MLCSEVLHHCDDNTEWGSLEFHWSTNDKYKSWCRLGFVRAWCIRLKLGITLKLQLTGQNQNNQNWRGQWFVRVQHLCALPSFKGKHLFLSPDSARVTAGRSLPTGVCTQQSKENPTVCHNICTRLTCAGHLCVCARVPQQLRMDLFLSALKGNTELSESDFPRWGPSVATAWSESKTQTQSLIVRRHCRAGYQFFGLTDGFASF